MEDKIIKTVYEKLYMYPKDVVDKGIECLSLKAKDILYYRYGQDLESKKQNPFYDEFYEKYFYFVILPMIRKNILEYLSEFENVKSRNISKKDESVGIRRLKQDKKIETKNNGTNDISRSLLRDNRRRSIYQRCHMYPRDVVDKALESLNETDKKLFYLMNGNDLFNPVVDESVNESAKSRYTSYLIPKIKKRCERVKTLINLGNEYSNDIINETLLEFNQMDRKLFKMLVGDDINNPVRDPNISEQEENYVFKYIIPKLIRKLENKVYVLKKTNSEGKFKGTVKKNENDTDISLDDLLINNNILSLLSYEDMFIIKLKKDNFSDENIADYLNIDVSEVISALKRALINYRNAAQRFYGVQKDNFSKKLTN